MKQRITESGSIAFNVIMATLLVAICVLSYMLITGRGGRNTTRTIGLDAPAANSQHTTAPATETVDTEDFNDGLGRPNATTTYPLDEFGAGVGMRAVFFADINRDGTPDRITRTEINSGTAHASTRYTIEIATDNGYTDITPQGFDTAEGADCALRKIRITLAPRFQVVRISRPMGATWDAPTTPVKEVFSLSNNQIVRTGAVELPATCDVAELF